MPKANNLINQRIGRLVVFERAESKNGKSMWKCRCECNNVVTVAGQNLLRGRTKSCGCLYNERAHRKSDTRLHRIWTGMKGRCNNPEHHAYERYGGRGITVCADWEHNFQAFYDWAMGNGYADNLTIDRIDNNKGYSPGNCRWATAKEQNNNRNSNHLITYNGKTQTIKQWSDELGIKRVTLQARLTRYHWDIERAFALKNVEDLLNEKVTKTREATERL